MFRLACIMILIMIWLVGCLAKPISVQARFPAMYSDAAQLRNIAVFEFEGRDGSLFSNQLTAELKSANLDGEPYFEVLSADVIKGRSAVRSTVGSRNLTVAMEYGRRLGVQGVYYGAVSPINVNRRNWKEDRTKCLERKNIFQCKKKQEYSVNCYEQIASLTVQPQLVNVQNGSVVYAKNVSSEVKHRYCMQEGHAKSNNELVELTHAEAAKKIRRHVAPYNGVLTVKLKNDGDNLSSSDLEKFKGALAFSNAGQMDRACAIWQEMSAISSISNKSIGLIYNLGVCAEIVANYDRAIELYTKADSMLIAPDRLISEARERAFRMKKNQEAIKFPKANVK